MRNLIIGVAALLAVAAVPGVASATTGYAGVAYTSANIDSDFGDDDADGWAVGGSAAFDVDALGLQLQVDGRYSTADADGFGDIDSTSVGAHLYNRGDKWLVGGALAYSNDEAGGDDADAWTVAAETQYYLDRTTLGAALSYSDADDADVSLVALDLDARHFITDNFSVGGNVGYGQFDFNGGDDSDLWRAGVNAEYQFASVPVSVFGGYSHVDVEADDYSVDALTIGARYNFGGTLFDRNRNGAGLNPLAGAFGAFYGL